MQHSSNAMNVEHAYNVYSFSNTTLINGTCGEWHLKNVRAGEHNMSQNEQTTLNSILRALDLMFLKYSTLYTCIKVIYYIIGLINITYQGIYVA